MPTDSHYQQHNNQGADSNSIYVPGPVFSPPTETEQEGSLIPTDGKNLKMTPLEEENRKNNVQTSPSALGVYCKRGVSEYAHDMLDKMPIEGEVTIGFTSSNHSEIQSHLMGKTTGSEVVALVAANFSNATAEEFLAKEIVARC